MRKLYLLSAAVLVACLPKSVGAEEARSPGIWPERVLITNDDGIEDEDRLLALASAFAARESEVIVAVPQENRSGTGHQMTLVTRSPEISVERLARHERSNGGPASAFYVVDGYPADCIVFALSGPLREKVPDLVISGINGGPNLAEAWLGSGTIGAARIAAFAGIPALAVSGIDEEDPEAPARVAEWVARLASSPPVRQLEAGTYLTVALPRVSLDEVAGVRVARRFPIRRLPILSLADGEFSEASEIWRITGAVDPEPDPESDVALHDQGYIVITPMRADEHHEVLLEALANQLLEIPTPRTGPARE